MKLKDFQLSVNLPGTDFRTGPNASRDLTVAVDRQVRTVCALYSRHFPGLTTTRAWKVLVECVPKVQRPLPLDQLGVLFQELEYDLTTYWASDDHERKVIVLDALHQGVLRVAAAEGWPTAPFEEARKAVIALDYVNEWTWPKPRSSPDRKWRAYLQCQHETDAFNAWLVVVNKAGDVVAKVLAISTLPSEFSFVSKLGSVRWVDSTHVALFDKVGTEVLSLSFDPHDAQWKPEGSLGSSGAECTTH